MGVYDAAGRLVTKLALSNGKTTWTANNHPAGVYFLKLDTHPKTRKWDIKVFVASFMFSADLTPEEAEARISKLLSSES